MKDSFNDRVGDIAGDKQVFIQMANNLHDTFSTYDENLARLRDMVVLIAPNMNRLGAHCSNHIEKIAEYAGDNYCAVPYSQVCKKITDTLQNWEQTSSEGKNTVFQVMRRVLDSVDTELTKSNNMLSFSEKIAAQLPEAKGSRTVKISKLN